MYQILLNNTMKNLVPGDLISRINKITGNNKSLIFFGIYADKANLRK